MTEEVTTEQDGTGTTEAEPEYVDVPEADYDDLVAFLENPKEQEDAEDTLPEAQPQPDAPEHVEPTEEGEPSEAEQDDVPKPEPVDQEELQQRLEAVQEQVKGQELLIQRRTSEIAEVKKQLNEALAQWKDGLDNKAPSEAADDMAKISKAQEALENLDHEEKEIVRQHDAYKTVVSYVDPAEWSVQDMARCLHEDGVDRNFISNFMQNPYSVMDGPGIVHLHRRATDRRRLVEFAKLYKKTLEENKSLKNGNKNVLSRVDAVARSAPVINKPTGSRGGNRRSADVNPAAMTEEELDQFLQNNE